MATWRVRRCCPGGASSSEAASSSSSTESESDTSPDEDGSESSVREDADDDHESAVDEDSGDAAIELAAAGVHSGTASEVMPESGCAKRAGITGNLDAQSKPASEATSSGQYPRLSFVEVFCGNAYGNFISSLSCKSRTRELVREDAP